MRETTFITDLNYKQVDVITKDETLFIVDAEEHTYFNVKIHWGLKIHDYMKEMDIVPFVDKVEVTSGDSVSSNGIIIVKHDFVNITFASVGERFKNKDEWRYTQNFLRDNDAVQYRWHITIRPKFVEIDVDKKIVEVIFNA